MMMGRRMIDCEKREAAVCGTLWQEVTLDRGRTLLGHNHHYSFIHPCHRSNSHRHHRWSCFWVVFKRVCQQLGQLSIKNCEDDGQAPIYKVTINTRTLLLPWVISPWNHYRAQVWSLPCPVRPWVTLSVLIAILTLGFVKIVLWLMAMFPPL